jgi:hypothetical protein
MAGSSRHERPVVLRLCGDYCLRLSDIIPKRIQRMVRKKLTERRKLKRFRVQDGAFAVVRPEFTRLGQIINISYEGLAFQYAVTASQENRASELDIFLAGDGFYMENMSFETVSDRRATRKSSKGFFPLRRCSVRFKDLTGPQIARLEYFIQNHTIY